eukprot:6112071-Amphidinium_carterae.1
MQTPKDDNVAAASKINVVDTAAVMCNCFVISFAASLYLAQYMSLASTLACMFFEQAHSHQSTAADQALNQFPEVVS